MVRRNNRPEVAAPFADFDLRHLPADEKRPELSTVSFPARNPA